MNKFIEWQLKNKIHIIYIYNLIVNDLNNYDLIILDKKKLYSDIVNYLYKSTKKCKYID